MLGVCTKSSPHLYTHWDLGKRTHQVLTIPLHPPGPWKVNTKSSLYLYTHLDFGKRTHQVLITALHPSGPWKLNTKSSPYLYTHLDLGKWAHHISTSTWTLSSELSTPLHPPGPRKVNLLHPYTHLDLVKWTHRGCLMKETREKERKKGKKRRKKAARRKPTGGWVTKERREKDRKRSPKDDSKKEHGRGLETGLTRRPRRSTWPAAGWSRRHVKPGQPAPPSHLLLAQVSSPVLTSRQQGSPKPQSVCIQAIGPHIHPLDFNSVPEIYSLKSVVRCKNTP